MPTYEYACRACDHEFEREQSITEEPIKECPSCGKDAASRMISSGNFILKGSGWYSDLYSGPSNKGSDKKDADKTEAPAAGAENKGDGQSGDGKKDKGTGTPSGDGGKASSEPKSSPKQPAKPSADAAE